MTTIGELAPGTAFSLPDHQDVTYIMLHFRNLNHEKAFILENVERGYVFESLIKPDTEVIVRS